MIANATTVHKKPKWHTLTTIGHRTAFNNDQTYHLTNY